MAREYNHSYASTMGYARSDVMYRQYGMYHKCHISAIEAELVYSTYISSRANHAGNSSMSLPGIQYKSFSLVMGVT